MSADNNMAMSDATKYRYKMVIEYVGAGYGGWQKQNHCMTIQQVIEDAFEEFLKEKIDISAAGRTDAGVNAYGQVAHFDLPVELDAYKLTGSLNHFIRKKNHKVGILGIDRVESDFHARFSATKRHYVYKILNRRSVSVIDAELKTHIRENLDHDKMQQAADYLIGTHNFNSFRSSICQANNPVKTMDKIEVIRRGEDIEVYFSALSYMHNMVRNIMGSLINVGNGLWPPEKMQEILAAKDRKACGPTAKAHGLYFLKVDY